jgi:hypothetical protein
LTITDRLRAIAGLKPHLEGQHSADATSAAFHVKLVYNESVSPDQADAIALDIIRAAHIARERSAIVPNRRET